MFEDQSSIRLITNNIKETKKFSFHCITSNDSLKELDKLNSKKSIQTTDMPSKIIKENKDLISCYIYHNFNKSLSSSVFPKSLKCADITPIKDNKTDKENYKPISILPVLSIIYERLMYG